MRTVHFPDTYFLRPLCGSQGNQSQYAHHGDNDCQDGKDQEHPAQLLFMGIVQVQRIGKETVGKYIIRAHLFIFLFQELQCPRLILR